MVLDTRICIQFVDFISGGLSGRYEAGYEFDRSRLRMGITNQMYVLNPALKQGLKTAARYHTFVSTQPPLTVLQSHAQYQEGFELHDLQQKLPFIIVPSDYDYSIQKGF